MEFNKALTAQQIKQLDNYLLIEYLDYCLNAVKTSPTTIDLVDVGYVKMELFHRMDK